MIIKFSFSFLVLLFYFSTIKAQKVSRTIFVDSKGGGDFKYVQQAIDSIPAGNNQWIKIHLKKGAYMEKVVIPQDKGYLLLQGEGANLTVITWGDNALVVTPQNDSIADHDSSSLAVWAPNVVLKDLGIKNNYGRGKFKGRAIAVTLAADKIAVYSCNFIGIQDTLNDLYGRHYFYNLYIEGFVDFIWGYGQSLYENCRIKTISIGPNSVGWITAHGRTNQSDSTGYVFKNCQVWGNGNAYLGRAWWPAARVIFYNTYMDSIIVPQGWDSNHYNPETINFSEKFSKGPGANMDERVKWMKQLSDQELNSFIDISYVDDGWISQQPTS